MDGGIRFVSGGLKGEPPRSSATTHERRDHSGECEHHRHHRRSHRDDVRDDRERSRHHGHHDSRREHSHRHDRDRHRHRSHRRHDDEARDRHRHSEKRSRSRSPAHVDEQGKNDSASDGSEDAEGFADGAARRRRVREDEQRAGSSDEDRDDDRAVRAGRYDKMQSEDDDADSDGKRDAPRGPTTAAERAWVHPALERRLRAERAPIERPSEHEPLVHASSAHAGERMSWMTSDAPAAASARSSDDAPAHTHTRTMLQPKVPPRVGYESTPSNAAVASPSASDAPTPTASSDPGSSAAASWKQRMRERLGAKGSPSPLTAASPSDADAKQTQHLLTEQRKFVAPEAASEAQPAAPSSWKRDASVRSVAVSEVRAAHVDDAPPVTVPTPSVRADPVAAVTAQPQPATLAPTAAVDLNKLHAAAMRAKLNGDMTKHAELMRKIQAAAATSIPVAAPPGAAAAPPTTGKRLRDDPAVEQERVELISHVDDRGMPIAGLSTKQAPLAREDMRTGSRAGKLTGVRNNLSASAEGGLSREAFTAADRADKSITELLREEMSTDASALDATLARNIASSQYVRADRALGTSQFGVEDAETDNVDDLARLVEPKRARLTERAAQQRDMQQTVREHRRQERTLAACRLCLDGGGIKKHLIISLGEHSMLMVPPDGQRVPGHMIIVPVPHVVAMTAADEEVYNEVNRFKSALHNMYTSRDEDVLFLETCTRPDRGIHTRIDVVPMDRELAVDAPLYFRKAIMEAEEWTTNKALIDTAGKGLRGAVPRGFPYFHVGWRGGGFVHVVEDAAEFPVGFGIDVCAGMMGLPPGGFDRRGQVRTFEQEREIVLAFVAAWEPFDWTKSLE